MILRLRNPSYNRIISVLIIMRYYRVKLKLCISKDMVLSSEEMSSRKRCTHVYMN